MNTYPLKIITPQGKIFDGLVTSLTAPGYDGELGILARHDKMVVILKKGGMRIRAKGTEKYFAIDSGVLKVTPEHEVIILADNVIETATLAEARETQRIKVSNE